VTDLVGRNITLKSDTVIVANGFNLGSAQISSTNTTTKKLWLVVPDAVNDGVPTCGAGSSVTIGNGLVVSPLVDALFYSPCTIVNSGDTWQGQMYASSITNTSTFTLNYVPIGLPNVNLSTGLTATLPGTGTLGDRSSLRNLSVG
jgi:hypothetical protein